jgi:hypothetical protein
MKTNEERRDFRYRCGFIAILGLFAILAIILRPLPLEAGCKSDCEDTYQTEIEDCQLLHDDSDEADDLQMCIDDAKSEHDSCVDECNS